MWHLREASRTNFVFLTWNLPDQLGKRHKFKHILHFQSYCIYQSCEEEDFNGSNRFLHLIAPIIERYNFINIGFRPYLGLPC